MSDPETEGLAWSSWTLKYLVPDLFILVWRHPGHVSCFGNSLQVELCNSDITSFDRKRPCLWLQKQGSLRLLGGSRSSPLLLLCQAFSVQETPSSPHTTEPPAELVEAPVPRVYVPRVSVWAPGFEGGTGGRQDRPVMPSEEVRLEP